MRLACAATFLVLAAAACQPPATIEIRRSALVPAAAPIERTGGGMGASLLEAHAGVEGLASAKPDAANNDVGAVVPSYQGRGGLRFRIPDVEFLDFGVSYLRIPSNGAHSVAEQPVPRGDGSGYTSTISTNFPIGDDGFRLGLSGELSAYSLPYLIYERCVANCSGKPFTEISSHRAVVPGVAFGVSPAMRVGRFTLHGQLTARSHPTIDRIDYVSEYVYDPGGPTSGPLAMILGAGVEVDLPAGLRFGVRGYMVTTGPVKYSPSMSAMLTVPLVRDAQYVPRL